MDSVGAVVLHSLAGRVEAYLNVRLCSLYLQRCLSEDVEVMSKAVVFFEPYRGIRVTNDITFRRCTTIESITLLRNKLCVSKLHVIIHTDFCLIPPPRFRLSLILRRSRTGTV